MRPAALLIASSVFLTQGFARREQSICGTYRDRGIEEVHLHRQAQARRKALGAVAIAPAASRDVGDIAIVEDSGDVISRRNDFNLDRKTIQFSPLAGGTARYRFQIADATYDSAAASAGAPLQQFGDDDSAAVSLPFSFAFFGNSYQQVFVNSDGNLTFQNGDSGISDRSLGRLAAGPPRIAGLYMDLDPSRVQNSVRVLAGPERLVVSWVGVPAYQDFGSGPTQTFQIRLYPDGRIEFAYSGANPDAAVVGISPGGLQGTTSVVSFAANAPGEYSSTVAERFGKVQEVDLATAAQKFYQTHDDSYDYLVVYNNLAVNPCSGSVACEFTVRNNRTGFGDTLVDIGAEFGSASRLQAVMNMGPLSNYPKDPNGIVAGRPTTGDTPLTILAHEAGHLFLAYASIRDPSDPAARPMLGGQLAHWAFTFDSEASLLEGNRIRDNGAGVSPRFATTATVEGYAPFDQYLMGFRTPDEVTPPFLVTATRTAAVRLPQVGVSFDGQRRDIGVSEIIASEGRRTPDSTVSQRHFRFAFILVVREGVAPAQADLDQIDTYRRLFETFYGHAASDRASADTALRLSLRLSTFPAAGILAGRSATATVSIQKPAPAPLTIVLKSQTGAVSVDPPVTILAGATSAAFTLTGVRAGVDEISAQPADSRYDQAVSRIQVLDGPDAVQLVLVSSDAQHVTLRVKDVNNLPYPGVRVQASAASGTPLTATSNADGRVTFDWAAGQALSARMEGASNASVFVNASSAPFSFSAPVNAASGAPGLTPGGIASIFGANLAKGSRAAASLPWPDTLAGVQVLLDGKPAPVLFVSDTQVNFVVPVDQIVGSARVTIVANGVSGDLPAPAPVTPVSPGIFFDSATGYGAILNSGTTQSTLDQPAARGDYVEIYATGLGPAGLLPQVTIGGAAANVTYSGLAPDYLGGLYQVNAQIPADAPSGEQKLSLTINGVQSNAVKIGIR
jgi:uncharacterized protein (TIGR03437 family)